MDPHLRPTSGTFSFRDAWTVSAPVSAVHALLVDLGRYPTWWPEVRAVARLSEDRAIVVCRSVLPYDLELELTALHRGPTRLEIAMTGDLSGTARWTLSPAGDAGTSVEFAQDVEVAHPWLALAARAARPVMVWNHDRMMHSCLRRLGDRLTCGVRRAEPAVGMA